MIQSWIVRKSLAVYASPLVLRASGLASKSPLILGMGKRSFYRTLEMQPDAALDYLQTMLTITSSSEDSAEGIAAFVEKRSPHWRGR